MASIEDKAAAVELALGPTHIHTNYSTDLRDKLATTMCGIQVPRNKAYNHTPVNHANVGCQACITERRRRIKLGIL